VGGRGGGLDPRPGQAGVVDGVVLAAGEVLDQATARARELGLLG
jgi:hypothetical protein